MDRRNFIGTMLAVGAGFMILPPVAGGRIWKAERTVFLPDSEVGSIWRNYFMSTTFEHTPPSKPAPFGSVVKLRGDLWYRTQTDWRLLKPLTRPIKWETGGIYAPYGGQLTLESCQLPGAKIVCP
jgi:hypothetical protein